MLRPACARLALTLALFLSSTVAHAGYEDFIIEAVQKAHPTLKFEHQDGEADAFQVTLPANGHQVAVRLVYNRVGFTILDKAGYIGIELEIDGKTVQIGSDVNNHSEYQDSLRVKSWGPDFDASFFTLNAFLRTTVPTEAANFFANPRVNFVRNGGELYRVVQGSFHGVPCMILYTVGSSDYREPLSYPMFHQIVLPGWVLTFNDDLYTSPELVELRKTDDVEVVQIEKYADDMVTWVDLISPALQKEWRRADGAVWKRHVDLADREGVVVKNRRGNILLREVYYIGFDDENFTTVLRITKGDRAVDIVADYATHKNGIQFWEDRVPAVYDSISDATRNCDDHFELIDENDTGVTFKFDGVPIRIQHSISKMQKSLAVVQVGTGDDDDASVLIRFGAPDERTATAVETIELTKF